MFYRSEVFGNRKEAVDRFVALEKRSVSALSSPTESSPTEFSKAVLKHGPSRLMAAIDFFNR